MVAEDDFAGAVEDVNRILTDYWPCRSVRWAAYCCCPCTCGLSLCAPYQCTSEVRAKARAKRCTEPRRAGTRNPFPVSLPGLTSPPFVCPCVTSSWFRTATGTRTEWHAWWEAGGDVRALPHQAHQHAGVLRRPRHHLEANQTLRLLLQQARVGLL